MDPDPYLSVLSQIICATDCADPLFIAHAPTASSVVALLTAIAALLCSAFVSGSETAFFALTDTDIDEIENEEKQSKIRKLLERPEQLLATILITNNLVNIAIVILCNYAMEQMFDFHYEWLDFVVKSVILTFILLLFGEIMPKLYSNNHSMRWALFACDGLTAISAFFAPASRTMAASSSIVRKVVTKKSDDISLTDLSNALEITNVEEGKEKTMLQEILKFGGKSVSEIMTPRVDVTDIDTEATFAQLLALIRETGYSRIPVYEGNQDNIKGVIYAKDVLPHLERDDNFDWVSLVRKPMFVPEGRMIDDILEDFRKNKIHIAIVVDEYGCTQGIVTLEDVLEEIVGEINDEYDDDEKYYTRIAPDTYQFQARTQLNDFYRITGLNEDEFKDVEEDAETIAGLLLNIKHDFPTAKEVIEFGRCRFVVEKVERHRIEVVQVTIKSVNDTEESAEQ